MAQPIRPDDLEYLGAFRLPDEQPYEASWNWAGGAMTYYPGGDPGGPEDGYPGSIFGTGHAWTLLVSEISIPVPIKSAGKAVDPLNTAATLQGFHDTRAGLFDGIISDNLRVGMEYLPKQGFQTTDKLHMAWGEHFQYDLVASHCWCELNLSDPQTAGPWYFGDYSNFSTNDYIFEIPQQWAELNTPGKRLASGRFRDGGLGGRGPALFAYGPWNEGVPPAADDTLRQIIPLLLYDNYENWDDPDTLRYYKNADEWTGGAWLTAGEHSAVIFAGTRGTGRCWYGLPDGTVWQEPYPEDPLGQRGWWCEGFKGQLIFYDPADLAAVARGDLLPSQPQPYDSLDIDPYLYAVTSEQQKHHVGAVSFDRARGHLFLFEPRADGDKCIVHVWKVNSRSSPVVPVELKSFSGTCSGRNVILKWSTESECNNYGFDIERRAAGREFRRIAFVKGRGTTMSDHDYEYQDRDLIPAEYQYRLKQIDADGAFRYSHTVTVTVALPRLPALSQNHPNPFNAATIIEYTLPEGGYIVIRILEMTGREVRTLITGSHPAGRHRTIWNGLDDNSGLVASGIYLCVLKTGNHTRMRKLTLLR